MVNAFLIVVVSILAVLILVASYYVLVYFQAEEDKNTAYLPKIAVVIGLTLTAWLVLMLPLDVANRATAGGFPMETMWEVIWVSVAVMCFGVVPFLMFYYESEDPESRSFQARDARPMWLLPPHPSHPPPTPPRPAPPASRTRPWNLSVPPHASPRRGTPSQWWNALKYEFCTVLVLGTFVGLMWYFLGYADVPLQIYSFNDTLLPATESPTCVPYQYSSSCASVAELSEVNIGVTPVVYLMAMVAFIGWFLFVCFVGVGLAAVPMDLLRDYGQRPEPLDLHEYAKQKMLLNERTLALRETAMRLGLDAHRRRDRRSTV